MNFEITSLNYQRWITKFDKKGAFVKDEINIDSMSLEILKTIFTPYEDDLHFIMLYQIDEKKAIELNKFVRFEYDFSKYQYELCTYRKE
jgi:hypothetical protein